MPLGPPDDPDRFADFDACVEALTDDDTTREEARRICGSWETNIAVNAHRDPTQTTTLRKRFQAHGDREWRRFIDTLREHVAGDDALMLATADWPATSRSSVLAGFSAWVGGTLKDSVAAPTVRALVVEDRSAWAAGYVRMAYVKGLQHADRQLRARGVAAPVEDIETLTRDLRFHPHEAAHDALQARVLAELGGIADATRQRLAREAATLVTAPGEVTPAEAAARLADEVVAVGEVRTQFLTATEPVRAVNEAALRRYPEFGVTRVTIETVERDGTEPCATCAARAGEVLGVEDAHGRLPAHPNCFCLWMPVVE